MLQSSSVITPALSWKSILLLLISSPPVILNQVVQSAKCSLACSFFLLTVPHGSIQCVFTHGEIIHLYITCHLRAP